jgi:hypothetical protein
VAVLNLVVVHGPNYMVHSAANPSIGRPPTVTDPHVRALILAWHTEWISLCAERQTILTLRQLAAQFGVSPGTIQALIRNQGQYKQPDPQFREANRREYYARRAALRVRGILA